MENIAIPEPTTLEEKREIEAEEIREAVEAHIDTLDDEEKSKVENFQKLEKKPGMLEKVEKGKELTPAQIRKRRKKEENQEERKRKRLERLERKQERLKEVQEVLKSGLTAEEEKSKIRQIEARKKSEKKAKEHGTMLEEKTERTAKIEKKSEPKPEVKKGRDWTLSIALPGSILDNAQSPELRTYLAGQIARAAVIFNVDEVIIFDESGDSAETTSGEFTGVKKKGNPNQTLGRILEYLECPQYLRKDLFPHHKDLKYAGLLNPLDSPHHLRESEVSKYREGIVQDRPSSKKKGKGAWVNCGIEQDVRVDRSAPANSRVTVRFDDEQREDGRFLTGKLITPQDVRTESGNYWGYTVRLAASLGKVFTNGSFGEYDFIMGTSERGELVDQLPPRKFSHCLIVFGGVKGLEHSFSTDKELRENGIEKVEDLFDRWVNVLPNQGSRTIRTEEAILVSLSAFREKFF